LGEKLGEQYTKLVSTLSSKLLSWLVLQQVVYIITTRIQSCAWVLDE